MDEGYNKPVQYGRESAHKSTAQGDPSSLGDYMNANQHISIEEYETIMGPERSQQLQILLSLTVRRLFCENLRQPLRTPMFSKSANLCGRQCFPSPPTFADTNVFQIRQPLRKRQCFLNPPTFADAHVLSAPMFCKSAYIFVCANILGLFRLGMIFIIRNCVCVYHNY
jgi:hypothetical protein